MPLTSMSFQLRKTLFTWLVISMTIYPTVIYADGANQDASLIFEKAAPSIVTIFAEKISGNLQGSGVCTGNGFGVKQGTSGAKLEDYVPSNSWVVTNAHVVDNAKKAFIKYNGNEYPFEIKYLNRDFDIAILFVDNLVIKSSEPLNSDIKIGSKVYAIGSPLGLEKTITDGIVSAIRQRGEVPLIQTTAAISPGNSGGGLFDSNGNLIGITTFKLKGGENINFAIRSSFISNFDEAIFATGQILIGSEQSLTADEKYKFINWFASEKNPDGTSISKYYSEQHDKFRENKNFEVMLDFDKEIFSRFKSSNMYKTSREPINSQINQENNISTLDCTIQGPKTTTPFTATINFKQNTVNGFPATISESEFKYKVKDDDEIKINRFTGQITMKISARVYLGKCSSVTEQKF